MAKYVTRVYLAQKNFPEFHDHPELKHSAVAIVTETKLYRHCELRVINVLAAKQNLQTTRRYVLTCNNVTSSSWQRNSVTTYDTITTPSPLLVFRGKEHSTAGFKPPSETSIWVQVTQPSEKFVFSLDDFDDPGHNRTADLMDFSVLFALRWT